MSQVVTELVIDSNTAGADQFSQAMDRAGGSAQQGANSVAGMTLAVAGVGVAFIGALAGLRAFYDYVGTTNKQLIDIAENAVNAGMSTKEFQESLFAAKASGLTEKDFVSGLDKISADLTAASRGVTDFGKLFEKNGISIRQSNGELKTAGMAVADLMGLMERSPPQIQQAIARIAGVSKEWVPFLRQGTEEFERQKQAASSLGIVIDDDVVQKAKAFDAEWKTAIAAWDMQFKASLASIMPLLVQMAGLAKTIIDGVGSVSSSVSRWNTPDDAKSKAQLTDQIADVERLRDLMVSLGEVGPYGSLKSVKVNNLKGLLGLPEDADIAQVDQLIGKLTELYDKTPTKLTVPGGRPALLPDTGADANDAVDRAINTLRRHTEQQIADTKAMGMGAEAQAQFRAEAALTSAIQANNGKITDDQREKFEKLTKVAVEAAGALARAQVASDIKFGGDTAFLSQGDVQIATQLRSIYPNVAQGLNSAEAAQLRFNSAARELSSGIEQNLVSGLTEIAAGSVAAGQGFSNMGVAVLKTIEQMIIKIAIVQPMMQALQSSIGGGGLLGLFGSFFGGGVNANGSIAGAIGPTSVGGAPLVGLHGGGIVGAEATFNRYVHPSYFDSAPRFHTGGIAGDEVPIIAKRGEGVFTQGQMAAMGGGGQAVNINYAPNIDARGADAQAVSRIAQVMAQDRKDFERNVKAIVSKTRSNSPGAF